MNLLPTCILYTQDAKLLRRVTGYLSSVARVHHVDDPALVETTIEQYDPTLLLIDLTAPKRRDLLPRIVKTFRETVVIAFGIPRSDPALEAEELQIYSVESADIDRMRLKSVVLRAFEHLRVVEENAILKDAAARPSDNSAVNAPQAANSALPLHPFSKAFRHLDDVDTMLENMVEGVASTAKLSRVGLFAIDSENNMYRFKAGIHCLRDAHSLEVKTEDPLVRWMYINAHMISRDELAHVADHGKRAMLTKALNTLGAEVIIPLHGHDDIIGWLFAGRHLTGTPFSGSALERLMDMAEHVATALENALLYDKVVAEKTLANTVLQSTPAGIVAIGPEGTVQRFNPAAEQLLGLKAAAVFDKPAALLGPHLSQLLARCTNGQPTTDAVEWQDEKSGRSLSAVTRPLTHDDLCMGAVAIVCDLTAERILREKQEKAERSLFWTELTAALAHEIRNPMFTISTFAQLLPEQYSDKDFRSRFSELVSLEVTRLNTMITQLDSFATQRRGNFGSVTIDSLVAEAIAAAKKQGEENDTRIEALIEQGLPHMHGDQVALVECVAHLIVNAVEATQDTASPSVIVGAGRKRDGKDKGKLFIDVTDNGQGIATDIESRMFSPFCTTKARGVGLGLPIARRTVSDHNGQMVIEQTDNGTTVNVVFPIEATEATR